MLCPSYRVSFRAHGAKMAKGYQLLVFLTSLVLVACNCPRENIHSLGQCAFKIECTSNVRGIRLPNECLEAANFPVTVTVTLKNVAEDYYPEDPETRLLGFITSLKITGQMPKTNLTLLQYTYRLQDLNLTNNQIERIAGSPFYYLGKLETIDLSHNRISDLEELFRFETRPYKLNKLVLANNNIEELPQDAFDELSSLVELDLSYNRISNLKEEPFANLSSLETLRLNNNSIKNLNGAVNNLQNLKHLYLRGNQIQHIDVESLKIIIHLETFDVSRNQLEKINSVMFSRHWKHMGGHSICKIILSENRIASLPNASMEISARNVRDLRRYSVDVLTELDLSNNEITEIAYNAFHSLLKMISLDLSRNQITDFSVNADDLQFVKKLNLSGNHIFQLYYKSFSAMGNLENLDLSHNKLYEIPETAFKNYFSLRILNMTFNDIDSVENLRITRFHPAGGVLDLSNNGLTQLRIPYGEGARLMILRLHSNNISDAKLIELIHQNDLKNLDLSHNKIRELNDTSLRIPVSLNYLDISFNMIIRIGPSSFYRAGHLKTLRLSHNQLTKIEHGAFHGLSALLNLDLSYNKFGYFNSEWLMDLKSLVVLSLRNNWMHNLDYKSWFGHKPDLRVNIEGNRLSCEWLSGVLQNFNNGFLKMHPVVLTPTISSHSIEGIPCIEKTEVLSQIYSSPMMSDDRLLVSNQKILEAVKEQTYYLRRYVMRSLVEETERAKL
ncbi:chaoptin-like [Bombyx mandarina]|uniref:Chaoptin-like n=1 Tax=Bombyx mandarina TaxID=7092 RepID=A0A6J2KPW5_BOMMA|nr:chaoptin-like [Bombyx mandarina]